MVFSVALLAFTICFSEHLGFALALPSGQRWQYFRDKFHPEVTLKFLPMVKKPQSGFFTKSWEFILEIGRL